MFGPNLSNPNEPTSLPKDVLDMYSGKGKYDQNMSGTKFSFQPVLLHYSAIEMLFENLITQVYPTFREKDSFYNLVATKLGGLGLGKMNARDDIVNLLLEHPTNSALIFPEGGFRSMSVFRKGFVIAAVESGISHISIFAYPNPFITLFRPDFCIAYVETLEIPNNVIQEVKQSNNGEPNPYLEDFAKVVQLKIIEFLLSNPDTPDLYKKELKKQKNLLEQPI